MCQSRKRTTELYNFQIGVGKQNSLELLHLNQHDKKRVK